MATEKLTQQQQQGIGKIKPAYFNKLLAGLSERGISTSRAQQEFYFASQLVNSSARMQQCTGGSVMNAVFECLNVGLSLNPALKFGYLIPRYDSFTKSMQAAFEPSYQGLMYLAMEEGAIKHITVQNVHDGDDIEIDMVNGVTHRPALMGRGDIIGTYGIAVDEYGYKTIEWMPVEELHKVREASDGYQSYKAGKAKQTPWVLWEGEMCRKALIKRLFKYVSKSSSSRLAQAIELDNADYQASPSQLGYIEGLLNTANVTPEQYDDITSRLHLMNSTEASRLIAHLKENQLDPIRDGGGAALQRDISAAVQAKLDDPKA
jgi:phage RecT family recombinase